MRPLIIGAGPAGLAAGAVLKRVGFDPLILERGGHPGQSWHTHYERLHLHTTRRMSGLPYRPFPKTADRYPSRLQVVDYLTDYANHFALELRTGCEVSAAKRQDGPWTLQTSDGPLETDLLVICTGYNCRPFTPDISGAADFSGTQVHSSEYRSGRDFAGKQVLVVGSGNSGAEIALDLHEQGATATLVVRSPTHVSPRDVPLSGQSSAETSILLSKLPVPVADLLAGLTTRLVVGDLSPWGIHRPKEGIYTMMRDDGRVAMLDVGTIAAIKAGHISVMPALERFEGDAAVFADGRRRVVDAVVWATGFRAALGWIEGLSPLLSTRGLPPCAGGDPVLPGLHFIGYRTPPYGALRGITEDALHLGAYAKGSFVS